MLELRAAVGGTSYVPTPEDVLWLSRAVEAEGEPASLVAQTLVNGFLWARSELGSRRTLAEWVQAYAQPVNPIWFYPSGPAYLRALAAAATEHGRETLTNKAKHRAYVHAVRTRFAPSTEAAVGRALAHGPELPEATDYGAPELVRHAPWKRLTEPAEGRNTFWVRPGAIGWRGYTVVGAPSAPGGPRGSHGPLLALLLVSAAVLWRLRG